MNSLKPLFSTGVKYMLLASLGFAGMLAIIKELSSFHVFEIVFFRSSVTAFFVYALLAAEESFFYWKKTENIDA